MKTTLSLVAVIAYVIIAGLYAWVASTSSDFHFWFYGAISLGWLAGAGVWTATFLMTLRR